MNFEHYFSNNSVSTSLAHPLHLLYDSLNTEEIQLDLNPAIITPIYTGGSRDLPWSLQDYRPVAQTSHLLKKMEKVFAQNIQQSFETHVTYLILPQGKPPPTNAGRLIQSYSLLKVLTCSQCAITIAKRLMN